MDCKDYSHTFYTSNHIANYYAWEYPIDFWQFISISLGFGVSSLFYRLINSIHMGWVRCIN